MKKIIQFGFLLLSVLAFVSCTKKPSVQPPADLVGEDTIVQMIADQLILESLVFNAPPEFDKESLAQAQYSQFFDKYNVTVPRYRSSLTYYFTDKKRMEDMMTRAKALIEAKKSQLPKQ